MVLSLEDAKSLIHKHIAPMLETIEINVEMANAYVLAEDIYAVRNQPPFDRSPLDGYALRAEDTVGASTITPVRLTVIEEVVAGQYPTLRVEEKQATRIMTGAPIPEGANCVIRQEDTNYGEVKVAIYKSLEPYQNYCYAGDEVVAYDQELLPGKIYNFSHYALKQRIADSKAEVEAFHMTDDSYRVSSYTKHSPGRRFVRAYYEAGKVYLPTDIHMSGAIMSTANCNCFLDIPAGNQGLVKGKKVRIFTYVNS